MKKHLQVFACNKKKKYICNHLVVLFIQIQCNMKKVELIFLGGLICIGLIVLGVCINKGLQSFSNKERVVTVKGLAEKNIKATKAEIIVTTRFSGTFPKEVITKVNNRIAALSNYLKQNGYDFKVQDVYLDDTKTDYTYEWTDDNKRVKVPKDRYFASQDIFVALNEVEKAETIARKIEMDLINKDLSSDVVVDYTFPELNTIKPDLIAESTKNARITGEQFATDSQSKLGKIKTASQGQISIVERYYNDGGDVMSNAPKEPYLQKVRVISTIVFFLED